MRKWQVLLLVVFLGCGNAARTEFVSAYAALSEIELSRASGREPLRFENRRELDRHIARLVKRLHTASWQYAWLELRRIGRYAVPALIDELSDTTRSAVTAKALPGVVTPGERIFLTRGEVAYALLREIIGDYSNYRGTLPPFDKKAWEDWWRQNRSRINIHTDVVLGSG